MIKKKYLAKLLRKFLDKCTLQTFLIITRLPPGISLWCFCREPGDNYQYQTAQTVGVAMCQALMEYDQGNYNRAFELLYPLRYRMVDIGGSDAQVKSTENE